MALSLKSRIVLILVTTTVVVQLVSFASVISIRARETRKVMVGLIASDVSFVQNFLRERPAAERARWLSQLDRGYYRLELQPASAHNPPFDDGLMRQTAQALAMRLDAGDGVRAVRVHGADGWLPALEVDIDALDQLAVVFERDLPFAPPAASTILLYFLAMCLPIVAVGWYAVRQATAPLARLAESARRLGANLQAAVVPEDGPPEVAQAARALNVMQAALQRHFDERTQILSAISHDLKTPLTRLRLRVEGQVLPQHRERFAADIDAMNALIQDGLDHAQSARLCEVVRPVDLDALLDGLVDDAQDAGADVQRHGRADVPVPAAPRALQRVLQNLVDNAIRYGDRARVVVMRDGRCVRVRVEDDGPGIPPELIDQVFDPFVRLEASRNRESGGTGLGLAIARNLAMAQGASLRLFNRTEGGLCAEVELPLP